MPTLTIADRRLLLRYPRNNSFSFDKVRTVASDQGLYDLGRAIASLQDEAPRQIVTVVTRHLTI